MNTAARPRCPCGAIGTTSARAGGLVPRPARQRRCAPGRSSTATTPAPAGRRANGQASADPREHRSPRAAGCARANAGARRQRARVPSSSNAVDQRERQVARSAASAVLERREHVALGRRGGQAGRRASRSEREPPLADDPLGLLGDDAEVAGDRAVVVGQRAVGEGVVGLLGVAAALEEQQQPLVPRRFARARAPARCAGRCRPRSPPTPRAPAARAPTGAWRRASCARRRRCRGT